MAARKYGLRMMPLRYPVLRLLLSRHIVCAESEGIIVSGSELFSYVFACLADADEYNRSPVPPFYAVGGIHVPVLPFPTCVRAAIAEASAIWLYDYVHGLLVFVLREQVAKSFEWSVSLRSRSGCGLCRSLTRSCGLLLFVKLCL